MKKLEKRDIAKITVIHQQKLMSCGGGAILDSGTGYVAFLDGKKIASAYQFREKSYEKQINELFEEIYAKTHLKTYYRDIELCFSCEPSMSYVTLHTGQLEITRKRELYEEEMHQLLLCMFRAAKENDVKKDDA